MDSFFTYDFVKIFDKVHQKQYFSGNFYLYFLPNYISDKTQHTVNWI